MDNDIFEVTRDDYVGFIEQIKPEARYSNKVEEDIYLCLKTYSKKTNKLLCERRVSQDDEEQYFVYEMPDDDERQQPRPKAKIVLETKEEVQKFFDILNKIQKGEINDTDIREHT